MDSQRSVHLLFNKINYIIKLTFSLNSYEHKNNRKKKFLIALYSSDKNFVNKKFL